MATPITDPSKIYLLIGGGDGYETHIVTGDKLEEAYLAMHWGEVSNCPPNERENFLEALRDDDGHWEHNYALGPTRYREELEDGYVEVILLTPSAPGKETMNHKLDTDRQVFFYEQDFYVLSNFSAFALQWKGLRFDTSEAAYHWEKFSITAPVIAEDIRLAPSAHVAFKIAELYEACRRPDWINEKLTVMRNILRAKVDQHEYVRRKLLATGDRELVEDSWRDDFWGWGPSRDGKNMLGRLWMEVRTELKAHKSG